MLSLDLREKIVQFLRNQISLDDLNDWVAGRLPSYLDDLDGDDANAVAILELGLAEMDDEIASEDDLRTRLRDFVGTHAAAQAWYDPQAVMQKTTLTSSTNETLPSPYSSVRTLTTARAGPLVPAQ